MKAWNYLRALPWVTAVMAFIVAQLKKLRNYRHALSWASAVVTLVVALFIGWWLVDWPDKVFTWDFWTKEPEGFRNLILTVGGPVAAIVGLALAGWRTYALNLQAKTAAQEHITDRFTRAIEQLGRDKLEIRLGAIYALERVAADSPRDHWSIMETLTAYVRENAPIYEDGGEGADDASHIKTDIQAVITVLGRRSLKQLEKEKAYGRRLDLSRTNLARYDFRKAHLAKVDFYKACLDDAHFQDVYLEGANFRDANLKRAWLAGAHLNHAWLSGANLDDAHLMGARLNYAHLTRASLKGAGLDAANLALAWNVSSAQIAEAFGDEDTILPEGLERPEHWSKPT